MHKSALAALFVFPMMLASVSLAQSSAPGASGPASTTRWADVEARAASVAARLAASPIVQDERRLSDTPDLISADKARWKQIEAIARTGALKGAAPFFDRTTLNEDANAFFDDRAASTYAEFNGLDSNGSRPSDTHLAVGCTHIGVVTNTQFAFYLKNGTVARGPTTFAAWWADSPLNLDLYDLHVRLSQLFLLIISALSLILAVLSKELALAGLGFYGLARTIVEYAPVATSMLGLPASPDVGNKTGVVAVVIFPVPSCP